jgi:amino-acid N-acetyltransferase
MNDPSVPTTVPAFSEVPASPASAGDALSSPIENPAQFVAWLRNVAPYVHAHRGKTFVVGVQRRTGGGWAPDRAGAGCQPAARDGHPPVVLVHGSRPQVQAQLKLKGIEAHFEHGVRITDAAALECAKEAAGEIRLDIEAAFSQGLPNTPMANAKVRVVSGNFVTARPMGIINGTDFMHTGVVRKVDADAIKFTLANNAIVLLSPLGFSPTGEAFNLMLEDVAVSVASSVKADKLILIGDEDGVRDAAGAVAAGTVDGRRREDARLRRHRPGRCRRPALPDARLQGRRGALATCCRSGSTVRC